MTTCTVCGGDGTASCHAKTTLTFTAESSLSAALAAARSEAQGLREALRRMPLVCDWTGTTTLDGGRDCFAASRLPVCPGCEAMRALASPSPADRTPEPPKENP